LLDLALAYALAVHVHTAGVTTLLLLGDSHLAHLAEDHVRTLAAAGSADEVVRAAVGGATSLDLAGQLDQHPVERPVRVVISVGANDAAPGDTHVSVPAYRAALDAVLDRLDGTAVVVLGPPPVDERRLEHDPDRTNAELATYAAAARSTATEHGGTYVDTADALCSADADVLVDDGLHLSRAGYEALLPVLTKVVAG